MKPVCFQINWQRQFGGGEVYTRFFTQALQALGWEVRIVVDRKASFWQGLALNDVQFIPIEHGREIPNVLPVTPSVIVTHTTLPPDTATQLATRHKLGGIVHMPLTDRNPEGLRHYHRIFAVSNYVRDTIKARGYHQVIDEALLGVADLQMREKIEGPLIRRNEYDWDLRKLRDRVLSWSDPLRKLQPQVLFSRKPGLTLGIVSRLTPIKQFPELFNLLAPILVKYPQVHIEVFGSGGYASVRDLKMALAPISHRVRFWGHQPNPAAVYPQLDYVLSGLPEREALGLNLIEAQTCGTPVLAINAQPFSETVKDHSTGFLYTDPRLDGGSDFSALIERISSGMKCPDPRLSLEHLALFSTDAFRSRVGRAMAELLS